MGRSRSVVSVALAILGCLLCLVSLVAVWARNQVLDTDKYLASVVPLAADPAIVDDVTTHVTAAILGQLDAPSERVTALVESTTALVLGGEQFRGLWRTANRTLHAGLVALLTEEPSEAVVVIGGRLTLDLTDVVSTVRERLVVAGLEVIGTLPPITLVLDVADADGIEAAREVVTWLDRLALWLPVLALVLLGAAVAVARRRARAGARVLLGVVAMMLVTLAGLWLGSHVAAAQVPRTVASTDAAHAYYDHLTSLLRQGAATVGLVALVLALILAVIARRAGRPRPTTAAEVASA